MKAKSLLALLLLFACTLCTFASCKNSGETTSTPSVGDASQSTSEDVSTEPVEVFPFEDYYEEQTLKILCVSTSRHVYGTLQFVPDPESNYTAVSEAVTNCIVHAYRHTDESTPAYVYISVRLYDSREITVEISDNGCGIKDLKEAMAPHFTTGNDERCGMGFLVMESFTDSLSVKSKPGKGTTVLMRKILKP